MDARVLSADMLYGLDWSLVISWLAVTGWAFVWFLYFVSLIYGKILLHKPVSSDVEKLSLPGVSIVKPLNSINDRNLIDNLNTFFTLNYPEYELLFCIQDKSQEDLIQAITNLISLHPSVQARIFIGAQNVGVNPKVNNMMNAYANAKYPLFMISDASIRMNSDTLLDMVSHLTEKVGLVHQLPLMLDGQLQFARKVEKVYFGGSHARIYLAANAFGINCMTSMSCLFRKKILDEEGGLAPLGCYLGEDYFLSQLIINKGWRVQLCSQPAQQNPATSTVTGFQTRMMRWMYMRFAEIPHLLLLEPMQEHIFLCPAASLAFNFLFAVPFYIFIPCHLLAWCIADYILLTVLQNQRISFGVISYVRAWLFRELSYIYLYMKAVRMRTVSWGSQTFIVRYGGKTEIVNREHSRTIRQV